MDHELIVIGGHVARARRFIIATGAGPAMPPIDGLDRVGFLTSHRGFPPMTATQRRRSKPKGKPTPARNPHHSDLARANRRVRIPARARRVDLKLI